MDFLSHIWGVRWETVFTIHKTPKSCTLQNTGFVSPMQVNCVRGVFKIFCPCCFTKRLTASMPVWFQLKHSHQQPYSLLRLHPDLPITIHHCFYLPFSRDGGKTRERVWQRKSAAAGIDRLPHVLKPDIDFLSFFLKWEKVHCPTKGDFYGDLGEEELKWASGAPLSLVDCV